MKSLYLLAVAAAVVAAAAFGVGVADAGALLVAGGADLRLTGRGQIERRPLVLEQGLKASPWTLTPSAIGSWIGEEIRTIGV